jgi:PKD repeat protein
VETSLGRPLHSAWRLRGENLRVDALGARNVEIRKWVALAVILCALMSAPAPAARAQSSPAFRETRYAKISPVCPAAQPGGATCFALARIPVSAAAAGEVGVRPYTVNHALESGPAGGYTPSELASAYGYEPTAGGAGQTVAIVDAYDDPNIESDLGAFDTHYGIAACTEANGCFTKVSQTGSRTSLPEADTMGWSVEISLDVETAHSTCPECKILLVEADNTNFENLSAAVSEAIALGATEVSNSYGGPEGELETAEKAAFNHPGVVITAATGDYGYDDWTRLNEGYEPPARPNMPASLPSVVAVGGTTLELNNEGKRSSETVWNGNGPLDDSEYAEGASGGGCSTLFSAQPWQREAPGFAASGCGNKRLSADVAAVANPYTGFDIYDSYDCGEECENYKRGADWVTIGGTSLATPLISSLYALAGGSNGVSYPALTLYGHLRESSALYDITEGGNGFCDAAPEFECGHPDAFGALVEGYALRVDCEYTTACDAAPGFDGPSGVGAPNGLGLFKPLLPTAAITLPAATKAGVAATFNAAASSDPYPGGSISSYSWSWGDGTPTSGGATPTHTYLAPGEYTVALTVTDNYGLTSTSILKSVTVAARTAKELEEEAEAKKKAEEELVALKKAEEAAAVKTAEEEAASLQKAKEEAIAKKTAEEVTAAAKKLEAETVAVAAKRRQEEEAAKIQVLGIQEVSPDVALISKPLRATASGVVIIKISCPAGDAKCAGTLTVRTQKAVTFTVARKPKAKAVVITFGSAPFTIAGGKVVTVVLHPSAKARALLKRLHALGVRVTIVAQNAGGASRTGQTITTLLAPKASHSGH